MTEYLNPTIACTEEAITAMRNQGIVSVSLHRPDFDRLAEIAGRDPVEAGKLNLVFGGHLPGFGRPIRYDKNLPYYEVLEENGASPDLRYPLRTHDPKKSQETGMQRVWPIPKVFTEEQLSWAAMSSLRYPEKVYKRAFATVGAFTGLPAGGLAAWSPDELGWGLSASEYALLGGSIGFTLSAPAVAIGLTLASQRKNAALRKKAHELTPFRIHRTSNAT